MEKCGWRAFVHGAARRMLEPKARSISDVFLAPCSAFAIRTSPLDPARMHQIADRAWYFYPLASRARSVREFRAGGESRAGRV